MSKEEKTMLDQVKKGRAIPLNDFIEIEGIELSFIFDVGESTEKSRSIGLGRNRKYRTCYSEVYLVLEPGKPDPERPFTVIRIDEGDINLREFLRNKGYRSTGIYGRSSSFKYCTALISDYGYALQEHLWLDCWIYNFRAVIRSGSEDEVRDFLGVCTDVMETIRPLLCEALAGPEKAWNTIQKIDRELSQAGLI